MVLHITFQSEAWSLSDGVPVGFIGFDPLARSTICTNSDWIQRFSLFLFFLFSLLAPLAKIQGGEGHHTAGWKCPKWPLLKYVNKPMDEFCCIFSTFQIPYLTPPPAPHPSPASPFPRCLMPRPPTPPPASLAHFVLTLKHCNKWNTHCAYPPFCWT